MLTMHNVKIDWDSEHAHIFAKPRKTVNLLQKCGASETCSLSVQICTCRWNQMYNLSCVPINKSIVHHIATSYCHIVTVHLPISKSTLTSVSYPPISCHIATVHHHTATVHHHISYPFSWSSSISLIFPAIAVCDDVQMHWPPYIHRVLYHTVYDLECASVCFCVCGCMCMCTSCVLVHAHHTGKQPVIRTLLHS